MCPPLIDFPPAMVVTPKYYNTICQELNPKYNKQGYLQTGPEEDPNRFHLKPDSTSIRIGNLTQVN